MQHDKKLVLGTTLSRLQEETVRLARCEQPPSAQSRERCRHKRPGKIPEDCRHCDRSARKQRACQASLVPICFPHDCLFTAKQNLVRSRGSELIAMPEIREGLSLGV